MEIPLLPLGIKGVPAALDLDGEPADVFAPRGEISVVAPAGGAVLVEGVAAGVAFGQGVIDGGLGLALGVVAAFNGELFGCDNHFWVSFRIAAPVDGGALGCVGLTDG